MIDSLAVLLHLLQRGGTWQWRHNLLTRVGNVQGLRDARGSRVFVNIFFLFAHCVQNSHILLSSVSIAAFDPTPSFAGEYFITRNLAAFHLVTVNIRLLESNRFMR